MNKEIMAQEIESLIRTLDFIQEEQTFIKRKLSDFLEQTLVNDLLAWAEVLHQEILNRETAIQLLKGDIFKLKNQFKKRSIVKEVEPEILLLFRKYKQQVGYIESEFITWKHLANLQFEATPN
jgi:hypothetical protein